MRLEMRSQMARIGMETSKGVQTIEQPRAEMDIQTRHAQVRVEGTLPKVQIDQSRCFYESGIKSILELTAETAQRARNFCLEGIARTADQGNQLADIHNSTSVIADVADDNAWGQFQKEFGMVTMPRSRPQITVIEGKLDIRVEEGRVENRTRPQKPVIGFKRGKLKIYLEQRNYLEIRVVGDVYDIQL